MVRVSQKWILGVLLAVVLVAAGCSLGGDDDDNGEAAGDTGQTEAGGGGGNLLEEVQNRGTLRCGVNDAVPGFGFQDEAGGFQGFGIDFCRVVAAPVLGDPQAVQ